MSQFSDREEAGRLLSSQLEAYGGRKDVTVFGLLRGGVPVASPVAERLRAPLDILVVRKLGFPSQPELAIGAVASGGVRILHRALIRSAQLPRFFLDSLIEKEEEEIKRRETTFRDDHPSQELSGRTVILVDDGMATGSTMLAAVEAVRTRNPREIVIAVPVASKEACVMLAAEVDKCVCLATPEPFYAVGKSYKVFPQIADEEVQDLYSRSLARRKSHESDVQVSGAA